MSRPAGLLANSQTANSHSPPSTSATPCSPPYRGHQGSPELQPQLTSLQQRSTGAGPGRPTFGPKISGAFAHCGRRRHPPWGPLAVQQGGQGGLGHRRIPVVPGGPGCLRACMDDRCARGGQQGADGRQGVGLAVGAACQFVPAQHQTTPDNTKQHQGAPGSTQGSRSTETPKPYP
jgi:hypothetical protein